VCIFFSVGCAGTVSIDNADGKYQKKNNYDRLEAIYQSLYEGMPRREVERLLGEPDYSPMDGQYYYVSDMVVYSENQGRNVAVGMFVDFRGRNDHVTDKLQAFWIGPIGE
jgi:hypothetical protein